MHFPPKHPARARARRTLGVLATGAFLAALTGCGGGGSGSGSGPVADQLYLSPAGGTLGRTTGNLDDEDTFTTGADQGLTLDLLRNVVHVASAAAPAGVPGLRFMCAPLDRDPTAAFDPVHDRELAGAQTGLVDPRGIAIAHEEGLVMVADMGASNIKVFGTAAGGDVAPIAIAQAPAPPWGLDYDEVDDRLYATLTDGRIAVYDGFAAGGFGLIGPSRLITIVDGAGTPLPFTLRGIALDRDDDRLVVADPGLLDIGGGATWDTDGRLFVIANPSAVNGDVTPLRRIEGGNTRLGNPSHLLIDGRRLLVADVAIDRVLVFRNVFTGTNQDQKPIREVEVLAPRGMARLRDAGELRTQFGPDVSDVEGSSLVFTGLSVVSNPDDSTAPGFGVVQRVQLGLGAVSAAFDTARSLKKVTFDLAGDAYVTFDDGTGIDGGIQVINRLARGRDNGALVEGRDRVLQGPNTLMVAPRGIDVTGTGLLLVAESNAVTPAILAFSTCAEGDVAPVFAVTDVGGELPWALDYDPTADRLFVGTMNGKVLVYDDFLATGAASSPARTIVVTDGAGVPISVDIRGLVHVAGSNTLILADVGVVGGAGGDGQILVVGGAAGADGDVQPDARIAGPLTLLSDPMAIAFGNGDLYVGEKEADLVLRFDDVLGLQGLYEDPPDAQISVQAPESMALLPDYLSSTPK